jgi:hypothetical protein
MKAKQRNLVYIQHGPVHTEEVIVRFPSHHSTLAILSSYTILQGFAVTALGRRAFLSRYGDLHRSAAECHLLVGVRSWSLFAKW